jgi:outer membrane protein assembly factor BamB
MPDPDPPTPPTKPKTPKWVRWPALVVPPVGLLLLWISPVSAKRKFWGSLWILFYGLCYFGIAVAILIQLRLLQIEFRGGMFPSLTTRRTVPDYDQLESHRSRQSTPPRVSTNAPAGMPYWTGFRGPRGDGHYEETPIRTNWPAEGLPLLWRQPIGGGYSSFVVANGTAFTLEQRRKNETITAYDLETGREIWAHPYYSLFEETLGGDGPRATPAYAQGKIYSLGALGILKCLDASTGAQLWSTNILINADAKLLTYGVASSPLIVDEKVIVTPGGPSGKAVIAYHAETSESIWKAGDDTQAYSSPMVVTLAGQRQLLVVSGSRALGLSITDGELLWDYPWVVLQGNRNIAQPVVLSTNRIFLSAGYGTGCAAVQISFAAGKFSAGTFWRNKLLKNKFTSSVFWNGHLYGLDEDILTCLDAESGERKWKAGRYGYGQLLLASGHLVILCGDGKVALVRATPDSHQELARFQAIAGKTWNHPAIAHGRLLVRNAAEMACFDLTPR